MESVDIKLKQKRNLKKYMLMRRLKMIRKNTFLMDGKEGYDKKKEIKNKKNNKNRTITSIKDNYNGDDQSENDLDDDLYDFENEGLLNESERREIYDQIEAQVKPNRPTQIPQSAKIILRYWLYRSRNQKKACSLVGGVIDRNVKQQCAFCGQSWGLLCQPEVNAEDLFLLYLRKINSKNAFTDKQKDGWQDFFQQNCRFRTECISCNFILADEFLKNYLAKKQMSLFTKREMSRQASRILIDLPNPNAYLNFLFEDQGEDDETGSVFKKRTQTFQEEYRNIPRQNTIISLQNRQSLIQNDQNQEDTDDFDMFKQKYSFQNTKNSNNDDFPRGFKRQMSLSRFKQPTPSQTFRDSYQENSKTALLLSQTQSNSKIPYLTQQTQEFNQPSHIESLNTENEETFGHSIFLGGKNTQNQQKNDTSISRKQSQLLGVSGISQIKPQTFNDFEDHTDDQINTETHEIIQKEEEDVKSKLDTARGIVQDLSVPQKKTKLRIQGINRYLN